MNAFSHLTIANIICDNLQNERIKNINRPKFMLGNILPDIAIKLSNLSHKIDYVLGFVKKLMEDLVLKSQSPTFKKKSQSQVLGIICHFIADFFCYPHNKNYPFGIVKHLYYEQKISKYIKYYKDLTHLPIIKGRISINSVEDIINEIKRVHKEYMVLPPSMAKDAYYSIGMCTFVATNLNKLIANSAQVAA
ncbi:MAG: zinc dependent phospholipase C family protein [Clostridiaceae bacterium]|nr:zinc dependent phospholipase C family protein [Clostridiaceae bacterium]